MNLCDDSQECDMPTIRGNARGEAAIRPLVLSLITIAAVVGLSALAALSPLGDDGFVYPDEADFDSDKSMDTIVLLPEGDGQEGEGGIAGNCTIGEVRIVSGTTGQTITRFVASTCDDSFGSAVSIIRDVDFDGNDDLIVGAPLNGAGRAYVFRGPFGTGTGTQVIYAHEADLEFFAPPDVERFGERVGMTTDLDGDGVPDLRIRGRATSGTGSLVRTFFVSGTDGFPLFVVAGSSPFNPWLRPQADVDDDGDVDAADLAKVVLNQGMSGPAVTIFDGDVNNDDQVNGTDVAIVQAALGISQLGPITIGTDPDVGGDWGVWICPPTPTPGYWCAPNCWDFDLHLPDNVDPLCLPLICQAWCGVDIIDHGAPLMPFETYAKPYVFEAVGLTQDAEWEILEGGERMLLLTDLVGPTLEFIPLRNGPVKVRVTNEICTYICQAEAETHLQLLDSDGDGMPNAWENQWSGVLDAYNPLDAEEDPDLDGIKNLYEFAYGTDPTTPDAPDDLDGDGIPDSCEIAVGTDPDDPTDPVNPQLDSDGDGVSDFYEICVFWTDPDEPDTDGDGIPDGWEIASGLDPLFQGDAWFDADGDGIANFLEYFVGSDPNDPLSVLPIELDADQDGILDWIESLYGSNPAGSITYAPGDMAWAIINDAIVPLDSTVIELCVGDCFKLHGSGWAFSWQVLQGGDKISEQFPDTPDSCLSGKWCIDEPGTIVIAAATADGATGGQPPEGGASVLFGTLTIIAKSQKDCEEGCEVDVGICGGGSIPKVVCVDQEICLTASGVEGPGEYQWTALEFVEFLGPSTGQSVTVRITGPGEVTVSASKNGCAGGVTLKAVKVDLDIDSNNDGSIGDDDDDGESRAPSCIVLANLLDADGDDIPNFADGYGLLGSASEDDDDAGGGQFAPVVLSVNTGGIELGRGAPPIVLSYSYSDPQGVTMPRDATGTTFSPSPGRARLWTKPASDARNPTDVRDGGDVVRADVEYSFEDLGLPATGGTIQLWLEALDASAAPGDLTIGATIGDCADQVVATAIGMQFAEVGEDESYSHVSTPQLSMPAPVVDAISMELANVRPSADGTQIIADLIVLGVVDDRFSDTVDGPEGSISELGVRINGEVATFKGGSAATVPVSVTKAEQPGSAYAPYDYSGSFFTTLPGVVIQAGMNHVELVAKNALGLSGVASRGLYVAATPPPDKTFWISMFVTGGPVPRSPLLAAIAAGWVQGDDSETLAWPIVMGVSGFGGGAFPLGALDEIEVVDPSAWNSLPEGPAEGFEVRVTCAALGLANTGFWVARQPGPLGFLVGTLLIDEPQWPTWHDHAFSVDWASPIDSTGPGEFRPFTIELTGPTSVLSTIEDVTFAGRPFVPIEIDGKHYVGDQGRSAPTPMLVAPNRSEPLPGQLTDVVYGTWDFTSGFGTGLWDTAVDLKEGVVSIGGAAWHCVKHYNTFAVTWRLVTGEGYLIKEDQLRLEAATQIAETLATVIDQLGASIDDAFYAVLTGDEEALAGLSDDTEMAIEFAAEIYEACEASISAYIATAGPFEGGRLLGRVTGEVAVEVAIAMTTAGVGNAIRKATTVEAAINKIHNLDISIIPAPVKVELAAFATHLAAMSATRMCFVAGTLVVTDEGAVPIECVEPGQMVLSRDPGSGEVGWQPVVDRFTTNPARLVTLDYRTNRADGSAPTTASLTCTPEHPFFVQEVDDFLPAAEVSVGHRLVDECGGSAEIVGTVSARGPPIDGPSISTFNIEVANWHTYFVTPHEDARAVWVHNASRRACERAFSIVAKAKRDTPGISHWDAFIKALEKTDSTDRRKAFDAVINPVTETVMDRMFRDAAPIGGTVDLTQLKTVAHLRYFKSSDHPVGYRLVRQGLQNHHIVPEQWAKRLLMGKPGMPTTYGDPAWNAILGDMPGFLMDAKSHVGSSVGIENGTASFHAILRDLLPDGTAADPDDILDALETAYSQWDGDLGPHVWEAAKAWLVSRGVSAP